MNKKEVEKQICFALSYIHVGKLREAELILQAIELWLKNEYHT